MNLIFILDMCGKPLVFFIFLLISIILFVKKPNICWRLLENSNESKKYDYIIYSLFLFFSLLGIILSFQRFLDLPAVFKNDFQYSTGKVISQDFSDDSEEKNRTVTIENNSGDVEQYYIFDCPLLEEGEIVTIQYYKHSRNGYLKLVEQ